MKIIPWTAFANNYDEISDYCKKEGKPVFLTKDGEGDLVAISMDAYNRQEESLDLIRKMSEDLEKHLK